MADPPGLAPALCGVCVWCISGMLYRRHLCDRFLNHPLAKSFRHTGARTTYALDTEDRAGPIASILTTHVWGGGGGGILPKQFFPAKICVPAPLAPTSVLTQNKGPGHGSPSPAPPPSPSEGVRATPTPGESNFQVAHV